MTPPTRPPLRFRIAERYIDRWCWDCWRITRHTHGTRLEAWRSARTCAQATRRREATIAKQAPVHAGETTP